MTKNATNNENNSAGISLDKVVSFIPLVIIACGLIGNVSSFLIFTFAKELNKYSSMVFLSFIAVTDTMGLFIWNLNHFTKPNFGISVEFYNLSACKSLVFIQYASLQASGLLYSIISVDRYFTVISRPGSFVSKLPFGTRKSAFIWSICIISVVSLFNLHLLLFSGYNKIVNLNGTFSEKLVCYNHPLVKLWPLWDIVQAGVYTCLPFLIMTVFNTLMISKILRESRVVKKSSSDKRKQKLTISLAFITCLFIVMTSPGTLSFAFFYNFFISLPIGYGILIVFDSCMFAQQTMLFFISYLTNKKFSNVVKKTVCQVFCFRAYAKKDQNNNTVSMTPMNTLK